MTHLQSRPARRILPLIAAAALLAVTGCGSIMRTAFKQSPQMANIELTGLKQPVEIRRDDLGIPYIEAKTDDDLFFAMGYVSARDRLGQMLGLRAATQGRLAEQAGETALGLDLYMRSLDFERAADIMWENAPSATRQTLQRYADGVNAYLDQQQLPADVKLAGFRPEPWKPTDSLSISAIVSFILAQNVREEIAFLRLAQQVGVEKAAWLMPIYPDEPLPFMEARKLAGLDLSAVAGQLKQLDQVQEDLKAYGVTGLAASDNWAVHKSRTQGGTSIVANDTHLPILMPSMWLHVNLKSPNIAAAGVAVAGFPAILAGYNGHVGWGGTMVMANNQDIYLEQLKSIDGKLHYFYQGQWLPCTERKSLFRIKGGKELTETLYATRHGALIDPALQLPASADLPPPHLEIGYGIAFQTAMFEPDNSVEASIKLMQAKSAKEALAYGKQVRSIPINLVVADRDNIGWQVTGRYPARKKGLGLLPSPGWTGEYDWQGFLDPVQHPSAYNPAEGYIATANNRTLPMDESHQLSASWYGPERSERIKQLLAERADHTAASSIAMQLDQQSLFAVKLRAWLNEPANSQALKEAIALLGADSRNKANSALAALQSFDGKLASRSQSAAIYGAFLHSAAYRIFGDELGPRDSDLWHAFLAANAVSYGAIDDHLLQRSDESPFWDDCRTAQKESKANILALALADSIQLLEDQLGQDRSQWQWGQLHTYRWQVEASKMAKHLPLAERTVLGALSGYFDRGPFPAGGDHTTLNVSSYHVGQNFDTWFIPAMRMIVDFSRDEPMIGINSTGQSGNPSSPHYDDAIRPWLDGRYQAFPLKRENIDKQYRPETWLKPK